MARTENVELTVLCLIHNDNQYLLQDRVKGDWKCFESLNEFQYIVDKDEWIVVQK